MIWSKVFFDSHRSRQHEAAAEEEEKDYRNDVTAITSSAAGRSRKSRFAEWRRRRRKNQGQFNASDSVKEKGSEREREREREREIVAIRNTQTHPKRVRGREEEWNETK